MWLYDFYRSTCGNRIEVGAQGPEKQNLMNVIVSSLGKELQKPLENVIRGRCLL